MMAELKRESATTRRVLERVPEDKLSWKPHAKSMSLGELALHIAQLPRGIAELLGEPRGSITRSTCDEAYRLSCRRPTSSVRPEDPLFGRERVSEMAARLSEESWNQTRLLEVAYGARSASSAELGSERPVPRRAFGK